SGSAYPTRAMVPATRRADVPERIAELLLEGFERHYRLFRETSAQAKRRFEEADWAGAQTAVRDRIRFYDQRVREAVERLRAEVLLEFGWSRPFADLGRDLEHVLGALLEHLGGTWPPAEPNFQVQVLGSPFYRNKAAYVIGKVVNGNRELPFVIPILRGEGGE